MAIPLDAMPAWRNPSNVSQERIVDEERQADTPRRERRQRWLTHQGSRKHTLTAKGLEQAQMVANSHANTPDLIIASPFLRAHACADAESECATQRLWGLRLFSGT